MPASAWSALQLAEFVAVVSEAVTEASAALAAVEGAAEALDAEVVAIVCGDELLASVGYPEGAAPVAELAAVARAGGPCELTIPGTGPSHATGVAIEHPPGAALIVARSGPHRLSPEEAGLLLGMARVASLTMRMLRLLDDERAARAESDRQASENARLLAALTERQAQLERLAAEQAALRRVATLVAGQPPAADSIFAAVAEEAFRLLGADVGGVCRFEPDGSVTVAAVRGVNDVLSAGNRNPVEGEPGRCVIKAVMRTGHSARVDHFAQASGPLAFQGIISAVASPIVVEGRVWGAIGVGSRSAPLPADTEQRMVDFTELVATAVANAESRAQLKASRARIVAAADQTRRKIERDLHDGLQQQLVTLAVELAGLRDAVSSERQDVRRQLSRLERETRVVLDELREIARGVHPAILSQGGLGPAIKALARRSALPVRLELGELGELDRLPEPVEVAAYYVVSEALTNTAKHAKASVAQVDLDVSDGRLRLSINDDGVGGADPARGSGILGLTDRVEALGGTVELISPAGGGTSLVLHLPIARRPTTTPRAS
jgi:signal transduction histidine kinase